MKKKTISLLLGLILAFSLAACGGSESNEPAAESETATEEATTEDAADPGQSEITTEELCRLIISTNSETGTVDQFTTIVRENDTLFCSTIHSLEDSSTELGQVLISDTGDLYFSSSSLFQPDFTKDCLAVVLDAWGFSPAQIEEVNEKVLDYSTPVELLVLDLGGYRFASFWDDTFSNCIYISPGSTKTDYQEGHYEVQPYTVE